MLKTKCVYEPMDESDGMRVLVTRYWPRGLSKARVAADAWRRDLAPSVGLLRDWKNGDITWRQYATRYRREMAGQATELNALAERATQGVVTLLCIEPEEEPHCHRHLLKRMIGQHRRPIHSGTKENDGTPSVRPQGARDRASVADERRTSSKADAQPALDVYYFLDEDCEPTARFPLDNPDAAVAFSKDHIVRMCLFGESYVDFLIEAPTERRRADFHFWEEASAAQAAVLFDRTRSETFLGELSSLLGGGSAQISWGGPREDSGADRIVTDHSLTIYTEHEIGQDCQFMYLDTYGTDGLTWAKAARIGSELRALCRKYAEIDDPGAPGGY